MLKLIKSLRWRLRALLGGKTIRVDGLLVSNDLVNIPQLIRKQLFKGTYEAQERDLVSRWVKSGDRVVEIGTGIGLVGLLAAKICGEDSVFCYEANPDLKTIIETNFNLNALCPSLTMKAVTTDGEPVKFYQDRSILSSSLIDRGLGANLVTVESVRISDVLAEHRPGVLIMDAEGLEVSLLQGEIPTHLQKMIIELHPHIVGQDAIDNLLQYLSGQGFKHAESNGKASLFVR